MALTLKQLQLRLATPQHVLIHLCEKGVIQPEVEDTVGRGNKRLFSQRNLFQFALALELRAYGIPVARTGLLLKMLASFERAMAARIKGFALPGSILSPNPALVATLFDGRFLVFTLGLDSHLQVDLDDASAKSVPKRIDRLPADFTSSLTIRVSRLAERTSAP